MAEHPTTEQRGALGDYWRVVRHHRLLILLTTLIGVGAALGYSATRETTYTASAILLFQDPSEDLSLTGTTGGVFRTAQQRAAIGADTLVTPALGRAIKRE